MKLPNGQHAAIDQRKLTGYALNPEHDEGKHKARLFERLLGITPENVHLLVEALRSAACSEDAAAGRVDEHGQRYTLDFELEGPAGSARVRSVWMIPPQGNAPRLVTCYIL